MYFTFFFAKCQFINSMNDKLPTGTNCMCRLVSALSPSRKIYMGSQNIVVKSYLINMESEQGDYVNSVISSLNPDMLMLPTPPGAVPAKEIRISSWYLLTFFSFLLIACVISWLRGGVSESSFCH